MEVRLNNWGLEDVFEMERSPEEWVTIDWPKTEPWTKGVGWGQNGFKKGYDKWWPSDGMKGKRHTKEAKQKMKEGCKKRDNSNMGRTNPITIDGVTYRSKMAAAKALNIPYTTFKRKYNGQ